MEGRENKRKQKEHVDEMKVDWKILQLCMAGENSPEDSVVCMYHVCMYV